MAVQADTIDKGTKHFDLLIDVIFIENKIPENAVF